MTVSSISVIIYSYKGKLLKDTVASLVDNATSNSKISITVFDQNPVIRKTMFDGLQSCTYRHIFWDWQNSPAQHKHHSIDRSNEEYILILSDNVLLGNGWDKELIDFIGKSELVVSGKGKLELNKQNNFYINKDYTHSDSFTHTNFIDRSLIFAKTSTLKNKIVYPSYTKYHGEEEALSLELFTSGVDIFSCSSSLYSTIGEPTLESLYVPFSLNHNYNSVIQLLKDGKNKFSSLENRTRSLNDFNEYHNNIFLSLSPLPFQTNDVEYDPTRMNFQSVDARKFVARTKAIH